MAQILIHSIINSAKRVPKKVHLATRFFLNIIFPQKCFVCGAKNKILCEKCLMKIDYPSLPESNKIFAATDYNDEFAKKAIWLLKYRGVKLLAEPLAELICRRLPPSVKYSISDALNWVIIPIPLSKKRLKQRGYNQTELIARYLSNKMSVKTKTGVLYKLKDTPSQVSIKDREKRMNNLKDSFGIKNAEAINGKNIILIDDVSTTGATIRETRKILRRAGAKKVIAMVVARG